MLHTHHFLILYYTIMYALEVMDGHCLCVVGNEYSGVPLPASPQLHVQGHRVGSLGLATRGIFSPQKLADAAHQSCGCRAGS